MSFIYAFDKVAILLTHLNRSFSKSMNAKHYTGMIFSIIYFDAGSHNSSLDMYVTWKAVMKHRIRDFKESAQNCFLLCQLMLNLARAYLKKCLLAYVLIYF